MDITVDLPCRQIDHTLLILPDTQLLNYTINAFSSYQLQNN